MALKTFRPLTPVQRTKQTPAYTEITKDKPEKALVETIKKSGGRNNRGRITSRHIGGGHKQKYRIIDFKRSKRDVQAEVHRDRVRSEPHRPHRPAPVHGWREDLHPRPERPEGRRESHRRRQCRPRSRQRPSAASHPARLRRA